MTEGVISTFRDLKIHSKDVGALAIHELSVFSGCDDGIIKGVNLRDMCVFFNVQAHDAPVNCLVVNNMFLYSCSHDGTIKLWSLVDMALSKTIHANTEVYSIVVHGGRLFGGLGHGHIKVWSLGSDNRELNILSGHSDAVIDLALDETRLYSCSWDRSVRVWDLSDLRCVTGMKYHVDDILRIAVNESYVFSCGADKKIVVVDKETLKKRVVLRGHDEAIYGLSCNETALISASEDGMLCVWTLCDFQLLATLRHPKTLMRLLLFENFLYGGSVQSFSIFKLASYLMSPGMETFDLPRTKNVYNTKGLLTSSVMPVKLGDFKVGKLLGTGSFGSTYRCTHGRETVVAKLPHKQTGVLMKASILSSYLVREAGVMSSLRHRNILPLSSMGVSGSNVVYIYPVMYCNLNQLLYNEGYPTPVTMSQKVNIIMQIVDGLYYLHEHGQLFRSLRPNNILFTGDLTVQLTGFCEAKIASLMEFSQPESLVAAWIDSKYVAPEGTASASADVYALGSIINSILEVNPSGSFADRIGDQNLRRLVIRCRFRNPLDRPTIAEVMDFLNKVKVPLLKRQITKDPSASRLLS